MNASWHAFQFTGMILATWAALYRWVNGRMGEVVGQLAQELVRADRRHGRG